MTNYNYGPQSYNPPQQVIVVRNQYENGLAVGTLVLGILTFFSFGATGIPAVIVGHFALGKIKREESNASGMAWTGLVLGYLAVGGWFLFWLLWAIGSAAGQT